MNGCVILTCRDVFRVASDMFQGYVSYCRVLVVGLACMRSETSVSVKYHTRDSMSFSLETVQLRLKVARV